MKKYFSYLKVILMLTLASIEASSCNNDDDSLSFTKEIIVGKWEIINITGCNEHSNWLSVGAKAEFKNDGTCNGWFPSENVYKIVDGRIKTYYAQTNEPCFVYTLLAQNATILSVKIDGTLDDNSTCTLTLQKLN